MMQEHRIQLATLDDRMNFVKTARKLDCDVDLRSGNVCVDGKSELGVMGFNGEIGRSKVRVFSDKKADLEAFKKWFV